MENRDSADVVFGQVMRKHRKAKGYTQEELGLESGLARQYISMLELGQGSPTLRTMMLLAKCFELSVGALVAEFDIAYQEQTSSDNIK